MNSRSLMLVMLVGPLLLGCSDENKSARYRCILGNFSVIMPTNVNESANEIDTKVGKLMTHSVTASRGDNIFLISFADAARYSHTIDEQNELLDSTGEVIQSKYGKIVAEAKISLENGKYLGREKEFAGGPDGKKARVRFYIVGDTLYQIMAIGTPEFAKSEETTKYFESFTLNK